MECRGCIPRTSALGARENQGRTILQMAEQNGGRVRKAKPEPVLPIPPGPWTYHGELQEPMELSGPVGSRRKVETPPTSFKRSSELGTQEPRRDATLRPHVGTINTILAAPGRTGGYPSRVLSVTQLPAEESQPGPKRAKRNSHPVLSFSEEDKVGTT